MGPRKSASNRTPHMPRPALIAMEIVAWLMVQDEEKRVSPGH